MLGSQVLDVLIGLVLIMGVVSLAASTIVEAIAAITRQRAVQLERGLHRLLGSDADVDHTVTIRSLSTAGLRRDRFPSYLSAQAFADVTAEIVPTVSADAAVPPVVENLRRAARRAGADAATVRAELERQFDEAMERLTGAYKRWTTIWLFAVGLAIAVVGNVSIYHVGEDLWNDTATRDAVVASAERVGNEGLDPGELDSVAATLDQLEEFQIPIGWTEMAKSEWGASFSFGRLGIVLGWLATAALVTLGAPFWFDLLQRLIALRTSGKPSGRKRDERAEAEAREAGRTGALADRQLLAASEGGAQAERDPDALINRALGLG